MENIGTTVDFRSRPDYSPTAQPPDEYDDVMAHTPDPAKYHKIGSRTILPRAKNKYDEHSGASLGFDPNRPHVVNVDPGNDLTGAGGVTVDMGRLSKDALARAAKGNGDPLRTLQVLAQEQQAATLAPVTSMPAPPLAVSPTLAPPPYANGSPPEAPVLSRSVEPDQMTQLLQGLQQVVAGLPQAPPAPQPQAAPVGDYEAIKMPFLGVVPQPPKRPVVFHLPAGVFRAMYHHVCQHGICLSLIYDNRWEGQQFVPNPVRNAEGQPQSIRISAGLPDGNVFDGQVMITEFNNEIGCLDVINLLVDDAEPVAPAAGPRPTGHEDLRGPFSPYLQD